MMKTISSLDYLPNTTIYILYIDFVSFAYLFIFKQRTIIKDDNSWIQQYIFKPNTGFR